MVLALEALLQRLGQGEELHGIEFVESLFEQHNSDFLGKNRICEHSVRASLIGVSSFGAIFIDLPLPRRSRRAVCREAAEALGALASVVVPTPTHVHRTQLCGRIRGLDRIKQRRGFHALLEHGFHRAVAG